tara:strand:+ start:387 stop:3554 length:3168 start_codon:yes stop_codon:yes gene_type:complete
MASYVRADVDGMSTSGSDDGDGDGGAGEVPRPVVRPAPPLPRQHLSKQPRLLRPVAASSAAGMTSSGSDHDEDSSVASPGAAATATMAQRMMERASSSMSASSSRGTHEERGTKQGYAQAAWEHKERVSSFSFGNPCLPSCKFGRQCGLNIAPAKLLAAHKFAYGDKTEMVSASSEDGSPTYKCMRSFADVTTQRRRVVLNAFNTSAHTPDTTEERFMVEGVGPVCDVFCRDAYGVPAGTWNKMLAAARKGELRAVQEWDDAAPEIPPSSLVDKTASFSTRMAECIQWWVVWLTLEDQMPNEAAIVHRVVVWESVYALEYLPDMELFGTAPPESRPRWLTLRKSALAQLSIEWFGADDHGQPLVRVTLTQRAAHSNFAKCAQCERDAKLWLGFRTGKRHDDDGKPIDARALKESLSTHIRDVKAQRTVCMRLAQECASQPSKIFGYDDACGSEFMYLPSMERDDAAVASRYKYRLAMQGNLYPGHLLRLSLILPSIVKGGNFGCSAYFSSVVRLAELNELGKELFRQTDSGSDNDCSVTHAFHWALVHFGVVQKVTWVRLPPKHSHNYADRVNSMVKEQVWPKRKTGGGCQAPWDFKAIFEKALATQQGPVEMAWHLANNSWDRWFARTHSINSNFAHFQNHRYWIYEHDDTVPQHGCVKVTYKESLTTTGNEPGRPCEFKPFETDANGDFTGRTKPEGMIFMQDRAFPTTCSHTEATFPLLSVDPGIDAWKLGKPVEGAPSDKTWKQDRVFNDVMKHRMASFPELKKEQWRALHQFHETYATAASLPPLPINITTAAGSTFSMDHGSPVSWTAAWAKVAWRFPRPHKPPPANAPAPSSALVVASSAGAPAASSALVVASSAAGGEAGPSNAAASLYSQPAALVNSVTGGNNSRLARAHGQRDVAVVTAATALRASGVESVSLHQLCFAVTPEPEGEFSVGVVRIEKVLHATVEIAWFYRVGWEEKHAWPDNPTFKPYMKGTGQRKVEKQEVGLESLLAVPVTLTGGSVSSFKPDAPSIAGQSIKLEKACVTLLRTFLEIHRVDLIAADAADAED